MVQESAGGLSVFGVQAGRDADLQGEGEAAHRDGREKHGLKPAGKGLGAFVGEGYAQEHVAVDAVEVSAEWA